MKYTKPPLTFEQQAERLIARGMQGDRETMIRRLQSVSYYRLSGYWYPFRNSDSTFKSGLLFDIIWERYVFDRRLRILVMDAIERIEVAVRTQLAHYHALKYNAFGYVDDPSSLPGLRPDQFQEFIHRVEEEYSRSRETFADHFRTKYGDSHSHLPIWMATEVMVFGNVLSFFRGTSPDIQKQVSAYFNMPDKVLDSWLLTLNTIRNICAHHGRLWNRELGIKPLLPRPNKYPEWSKPVAIPNHRVFAILTICRYCLQLIAPQSHWPERVSILLKNFPGIPLQSMGFPDDWQQCPIWKNLEELGYGG